MSAFIIYLIKANIALTLFYLAYRFILRRLTFYRLNRYFLLSGIGVSALFPRINFSAFSQHHQEFTAAVTTYSPHWENLIQSVQPETLSIWTIVEYIFWIGVALMSLRFIIQLLSLLRIHLKTQKEGFSKEIFYRTKEPLNPFSFFHHIYVNPDLHSPEELSTIIAHEKMHVKGRHSVDILLGEINTIFYWFNPGAWLMKLAIRENLEFLTDQRLLDAGINAKEYQYSLLKTLTGLSPNPLTNHFNLFHLKQRIKMMNKKRSSKRNLLRYFILTPLLLGVVLVFTFSRQQKKQEDKLIHTASSQLQTTVKGNKIHDTSILSIEKRKQKYDKYIAQNQKIKSIGWARFEGDSGTEAIIRFKNGTKKKLNLKDQKEVEQFEDKHGKLPPQAPPPPDLIKKQKADTLDPQTGPILFDPSQPKGQWRPSPIAANNWKIMEGKDTSIENNDVLQNAQYIIDGQNVGQKYFKALPSEEIYSISGYMDSATLSQLPKGKTSLIKIVTKAYHKAHPEEFHSQKDIKKKDQKKTVPNAQYMVDGQRMDPSDFKENIKPEDIYSINVYKDSATVAKLPKGKTSLIKIVTKAYHKAHPEESPASPKKARKDTIPKVYSSVEQMPSFPGGQKALMSYLGTHIKYPKEAKAKKIRTTIVVQFIVQKDGSITHITTTGKKKGYGLEEAAIHGVENMPKWIPGKQDGKPVTVKYTLPVRFVSKDTTQKTTVHYTPPKVKRDSTILTPLSTKNKIAQKALDALKKKEYKKAESYARKVLKKDPNDAAAQAIIDYLKKLKTYHEKLKEYKEQHPDRKNTQKDTGIGISVHYTPTENITSKFTSTQQTQPFLREFSPNNYRYFVNGKEVKPSFIKQDLHPEYIGSIRVLKKDALPKEANQKKGEIYIQTSEKKKYFQELHEKAKAELSQPAAPKLNFNKSPSTSIQLSINRKLDIDSLNILQKGFREWGIEIAYKNLKFNSKGALTTFSLMLKTHLNSPSPLIKESPFKYKEKSETAFL